MRNGSRPRTGRRTRCACSPAAPLTHSLGEVQDRIRAFCAKHRKAELFARGIAGGATLAPVNTIADVLALDHLHERDYWQPYRLPDGRVLRAPGPFVRLSRTPVAFSRPAPAAGEHSEEILGSTAAARHASIPHESAGAQRGYCCRSPESRSPTSRGSVSGRSPPSTSPTTERRWCTSRPSAPPTGCASSDRSRTTFPASTAASSSARSTPRSCHWPST